MQNNKIRKVIFSIIEVQSIVRLIEIDVPTCNKIFFSLLFILFETEKKGKMRKNSKNIFVKKLKSSPLAIRKRKGSEKKNQFKTIHFMTLRFFEDTLKLLN